MEYQTDLLSIIVPVYNNKRLLGRCIDSLISQSYYRVEIILVDDGSTDGSSELCDEFITKDERIRVFHQKNKGPGAARNLGLSYAKGEYITFVDSDDCVERDGYRKILNSKYKNADIIIGRWHTFFEDGKVVSSKKYTCSEISKNKVIEAVIKYDNKFGGGYPWNKIINWKKVKEQSGGSVFFEEKLKVYEDKCWILDILKNVNQVVISDVYIYKYYYWNNSLSHSMLGTQTKNEQIAKALAHMMRTYQNTAFEKYITIEMESNKLNEVWYKIKSKDVESSLEKEWTDYLNNKEYSFLNYNNIMKMKYILAKLRMIR